MKLIISLPLALILASCASTPKVEPSDFFEKVDRDDNGVVSRQETIELIIEDAFEAFDIDGDGLVDLAEFKESGGTLESFKSINTSGTGKITLSEAMASPKVFNTFVVSFDEADSNNDGFVTRAEYLAYVESVNEIMR